MSIERNGEYNDEEKTKQLKKNRQFLYKSSRHF